MIKDRIREDMKAAMRAHDAAGLSTIRLLLAAIKQREVDEQIEADDALILSVIATMVKQRQDSVQQYLAGDRQDLADKESVEIKVLEAYLPKGLSDELVIKAISPKKDVDAFSAENVGHIMIGDHTFLPCTPAGIMEMLKYYNIDVCGKECVVVGRSNIVGKPMAMLLLQQNGTVTICHSKTKNLKEVTRRADILVAAVGKPYFVTADMVKDGAVVIDVGMDRNSEGKLCGDVDFAEVSKKASYITPVPGGVGPMTIATLLKNTVTAAKQQNGLI